MDWEYQQAYRDAEFCDIDADWYSEDDSDVQPGASAAVHSNQHKDTRP